jgi:hypothetical protein
MPTILSQDGFDVMIFSNDHAPAHVHVLKAGAIVESNEETLLEAWREIHGDE